jgi:hypothetical protein
MNKELTEKLFNDFPVIYRGRTLPLTQGLMGFGFEHDDGWYDILYSLSEKLEALAKKMEQNTLCVNCGQCKETHGHQEPRTSRFGVVPPCETYEPALPIVVQAKEKYGTLRFYAHYTTDEMEELISQAEKKSETTCETCGGEGVLRGNGWLMTRCKNHAYSHDVYQPPTDGDENE